MKKLFEEPIVDVIEFEKEIFLEKSSGDDDPDLGGWV